MCKIKKSKSSAGAIPRCTRSAEKKRVFSQPESCQQEPDIQVEIHNCVFNGKLEPYRPNIFEKLHDCAFFRFLPEGPARCQTCRRVLRTM